jgi:hypothetical protein
VIARSRSKAARPDPEGPGSDVLPPEPSPAVDPHPWRLALLLGLAVVAAGMIWSIAALPRIKHTPFWLVPFDAWAPIGSAQYVANGALGYLYTGSPLYVLPPLFAIMLAPLVWIAQTTGMTWNGGSLPVPHPTFWLVYGPVGLGLTVFLFRGVRAVAADQDLSRLWQVQVAALMLVAIPVAVEWGHYEEILALVALLAFARQWVRGRHGPAAFRLSVAIALAQWAILAVPVAVAMAPKGRRTRTLGESVALPALLIALPLAADWRHTSAALLRTKVYPWLGHPAAWVIHPHRVMTGTTWRLGGLALAVLVAFAVRNRFDPATLFAALAVVLLGRLLFEPTLYCFFLGAGLLMLMLHERAAHGTVVRATATGLLALAVFYVHTPQDVWWILEVAVLGIAAWPAIAHVARGWRTPAEPALEPSSAPDLAESPASAD